VGEFAVSQLSSTPLMTIADMSTINIEVNVDETEIASVDVGQEAKLKLMRSAKKKSGPWSRKRTRWPLPSQTPRAGLSNRVNVQEAKEFKVTLELRDISDDVKEKLRPGMSATATVTTKTKGSVIAVPLQAIVEKAPAAPSPGPSIASSAPPPPGEKTQGTKRRLHPGKGRQGEVCRSDHGHHRRVRH
jgi:HlyD family secretion protein